MTYRDVLTDPKQVRVNSELIVTLAKQALNNIAIYEPYWHTSERFREEFGTVTIAMPRQSGHSIAALQLLYEYPTSLLYVPNSSARDYIIRQLAEYTHDEEVHRRVQKATSVISSRALAEVQNIDERPFIIFDQYHRMQTKIIDAVVSTSNAKIIVKLQ